MPSRDFEKLLDEDGWHAAAPTEPRATVMVVDDDPTVRHALQSLLERQYRVVVAASAEEAVAAVDKEVHAVVLDIKMKGHDGFWACGEIRKKYPAMPIIFYSAYQDLKDPYQIINEHYPVGYITKGGDTALLLGAIGTAVRLSMIARYSKHVIEELQTGRGRGG